MESMLRNNINVKDYKIKHIIILNWNIRYRRIIIVELNRNV